MGREDLPVACRELWTGHDPISLTCLPVIFLGLLPLQLPVKHAKKNRQELEAGGGRNVNMY